MHRSQSKISHLNVTENNVNQLLLRRLIAATLLVSFVAMATSGIMLFVVEKPSFTIAMHPVHKLFGLFMVLGACGHLWLNRRALLNHLRERSSLIVVVVLTVVLVAAYGVVLNTDTSTPEARQMDTLASQLGNKP